MIKEGHLPTKCEGCRHEWEQPLDLPMDMSVFAKLVKKIRCPQCGGKKLVFIFGGAK